MTPHQTLDFDSCYRAASARDMRFDGRFYTAVTSTGIYCRPICPARTPARRNVRFYRHAAAAEAAGFRPCRRCRPELSPGDPGWDVAADLVGRALRLIDDGVADEYGVAGLAQRLHVTERHLLRLFTARLGAGPLAVARTRRLLLAKQLLTETALPITDVAFAAGFGSVRQFNATMKEAYGFAPSELRTSNGPLAAARRAPAPRAAGHAVPGTRLSAGPAADRDVQGTRPGDAQNTRPGDAQGTRAGDAQGARLATATEPPAALTLRLNHRAPYDAATLLGFLAARAIPGMEEASPSGYRRAVTGGSITLTPADGHVKLSVTLDDTRHLAKIVSRCRRLLDLDADPVAIADALGATTLRALVATRPGLRVPGAFDGFELAVRAVVGQQVSVAGARTLLGRIVARAGTPARPTPPGGGIARPTLPTDATERPTPPTDATERSTLPTDMTARSTPPADAPQWSTPSADVTGGAGADGPFLLFPTAERLAEADLSGLGLTGRRVATLKALAEKTAAGELDLDAGADPAETAARLLEIPGIGPWTTGYIVMRALRDPDAWPDGDLGLRRAMRALDIAEDDVERWRPWRAYAAMHLWSSE
ncbi:AlkA N-terminal domain-containing protein [Sphaerisporangium sp. NPDC005289]|uniref:DNA-3-methyladenine glycosylase 2 family protein n=1 Tax=Sphaerisporangium sp. NPDC005289 TaxID=3155247 RepID=UPI0033A2C3F5